jgi:SAM-dependent MidA family methyltransferase
MTDSSHPELCQFIRQKIQERPQKRVTFAEYMTWVLYHPEYGYYSRGAGIGASGDFATSPHLCADFGETLAEQFVEMWQVLGCPQSFQLVEMGAGQGILAGDILRYLRDRYPDFFRAIEYIVVEKSESLKTEQQHRLRNAPIQWCNFEELDRNSIVGCFFSNELVDAFPVHQFVIQSGKLHEIYVAIATERSVKTIPSFVDVGVNGIDPSWDYRGVQMSHCGRMPFAPTNSPNRPGGCYTAPNEEKIEFVEVVGEPSNSQLAEYLEFSGVDITQYPEGYRSEVHLAALDWVEMVAQRLQRGYVLTIDYGYSADRYYSLGRDRGTLQCYYRHRYHDNPYVYIGNQDITAHVNFTALQRQGELLGLSTLGFTPQGLFLMALGWGDRLVQLGNSPQGQKTATARDIARIMQRRQTLHALIDPMGFGKFGVLIQGKGLSDEESGRWLKGLTEPL